MRPAGFGHPGRGPCTPLPPSAGHAVLHLPLGKELHMSNPDDGIGPRTGERQARKMRFKRGAHKRQAGWGGGVGAAGRGRRSGPSTAPEAACLCGGLQRPACLPWGPSPPPALAPGSPPHPASTPFPAAPRASLPGPPPNLHVPPALCSDPPAPRWSQLSPG